MGLIEKLLGERHMIEDDIEEIQLRTCRGGEPMFEGFKDLKGTLDKSNTLLEQIVSSGMIDKVNSFLEHLLPILIALNTGEKFIEIVIWKFPIKISLKDKILKNNKVS